MTEKNTAQASKNYLRSNLSCRNEFFFKEVSPTQKFTFLQNPLELPSELF